MATLSSAIAAIGMETYRTKDGTVIKYVHSDGSETCVKTVPSCDNVVVPETGDIVPVGTDRNKYSVFLSSSVGCRMKCSMCWLTLKRVPHASLSRTEMVGNALAAVEAACAEKPEMRGMFAKLCWMGMGDPLLVPGDVRSVTASLAELMLDSGLAAGIDGCDASTCGPSGRMRPAGFVEDFAELNGTMGCFPKNPGNRATTGNMPRSPFRLFYSLHSAVPETRSLLIPGAEDPGKLVREFRRMSDDFGINVVIHHLPVAGVNDSDSEVSALLGFLDRNGLKGCELRVLRFNKCPGSRFGESPRFMETVRTLAGELPHVKVQTSPGSEVLAACGQFLLPHLESL